MRAAQDLQHQFVSLPAHACNLETQHVQHISPLLSILRPCLSMQPVSAEPLCVQA